MLAQKPTLVIVIPCYNEEQVLNETAKQLLIKISKLISDEIVSSKSTLLFVDDGSHDNTWGLIEKYHNENPMIFNAIKLSANKGQRNALLCGLFSVKDYADVTITIDADLQDDIAVIDQMLEHYFCGSEIVFGVHSNRENDSFFKKTPSCFFYGFMRLLGVDVVKNHAHFRLLGRKALNALLKYSEVNLFLPGIISKLGFKSSVVDLSTKKRLAGKSKYNMSKLLDLAIDAVTSFSIKPIRFISFSGILLCTIGLILTGYYSVKFFSGFESDLIAVLLCSSWMIGGMILFSIGVVGEYIGKIYSETKHRPRYHIEQTLFRQELKDDTQ